MKRNLSEEKFPLIPAGEQTVRIVEIDESKYTDFQALTVVVEDAAGATARVNFNFLNDDGSPNDTADFVYGRMCRAALDQLHPLQARMAASAHDDVVVHGDAERARDADDGFRHLDVGLRGRGIAGRMVVHEDQSGCG